ncbi:MAG TPA: ATP-binding protein [Acidobacteriaceae bacterium]|jgi:signal transduction histidine kinase|nr:ATP-binding protein [Acidobacteriaceae bacterium]
MRLRTKLVLTASGLTFAIVLVLAIVFLAELLQQRVDTTAQDNEVLAQEVLLSTRQAVDMRSQIPLQVKPGETPDDAVHDAVVDALRSSDDLMRLMDGIVRYSKTVQDVSVTDAHGFTIVSTDPDEVNQRAPYRDSFASIRQGSAWYQIRQVFGNARVIDISKSLERKNMPFLVVHVGIRSTFLRNAYEPWLRDALKVALLAILASVLAAALLSAVALRPLEVIGEQLERLTLTHGETVDAEIPDESNKLLEPPKEMDAVGRVNLTIDKLGREMRSREAGYTALQANLNQMLDTLRDGVMLIAPDRRAVMISDAVAHFLATSATEGAPPVDEMVGMKLDEIFSSKTRLGGAVLAAYNRGAQISAETVTLEDGRQVQISLDRIGDAGTTDGPDAGGRQEFGTLLTLRDTGTALELEQELEVSRRLAAIGSLTANVGHEVKNPINAMVVHLELLRSKLATGPLERESAQKHVDILADEMHRLDRVVQTLADFSRPMELELREHDLRRVVEQTIELASAEFTEHGVAIENDAAAGPVMVRVDAELLRQALLNLLLNAMQAMPEGGIVRVAVRRDQRIAVVEIADNGVGIPMNLLPRIFDLYFTTKPKGSGIGLAMTYRIVKLHGGTMDVRSEAEPNSPKRGTTITLRIPVSVSGAGRSRLSANGDGTAIAARAEANNMERKEIA